MIVYLKKGIIFCGLLMLVVWQVSFLSVFQNQRPILFVFPVIILFTMFLGRFVSAFNWTVVIGLLLDLNSPYNFGALMLPLLIAFVICYLLLHQFVTVQSLYAVLLLLLCFTTVFYVNVWFLGWVFNIFGVNFMPVTWTDLPHLDIAMQLVINSVLATLIFFALRVLKQRFVWVRHF